jgi:hypothetical protein
MAAAASAAEEDILAELRQQRAVASFAAADVTAQIEELKEAAGGRSPFELLDEERAVDAATTVLSPLEALQVLSVLEFALGPGADGAASRAAGTKSESACASAAAVFSWRREHDDPHVRAFFRACEGGLPRTLQALGFALGVGDGPTFFLLRGGRRITVAQAEALRRDLETLLALDGVFDYLYTVERMLRGCAQVLEQALPFLPGLRKELDAVRVRPNQVSGEDFM